MKHKLVFACLVLLISLALPVNAMAAGEQDGKVVWGGTYSLGEGETIDGDLLIVGGVVSLAEGSRILGDVVLFGGTLSADGVVEGNLAAIGGMVSLGPQAVIHGDLVRMGAVVDKAPGAVIEGNDIAGEVLNIPSVELPFVGQTHIPYWDWNFSVSPLTSALSYLIQALLLAALAVLVVMFFPEPTSRVARAVIEQPLYSGVAGLVAMIVSIAALIVLFVSICLCALGILGAMVLVVAAAFGWIGIGLEIGRRLATIFKWTVHPAAAAGLGTLVLSIVANGIGFIPCVGWLAPTLVTLFGLGAVVLTRFGTRLYLGSGSPALPAPPAPPAAPEAPAA